MSNDLNKKIDKIEESLMDLKIETTTGMAEINKNLAIYNEQLKIHIEGVKQTREENRLNKLALEAKIAPLEDHVKAMNGVAKGLVILATVLGIIGTILKFTGHL